mgnify:CR=1 FL=1
MARIRAKTTLRLVFVVGSLVLLGVSWLAFREGEQKDWKRFQDEYQATYKQKVSALRDQAAKDQDEAGVKKWSRLLEEARDGDGHKIRQVFLPDAGVRDLCLTCHLGMENPLFAEAANPLRQHPPEILKDHKPTQFGCTLCHHGQGVGLTVDKAHGFESNWEAPRLPRRYVQATCLGCHETPFQLAGAERAERGRLLFLEHACYGCHDVRSLQGLPYRSFPLDGTGLKIENATWLRQWLRDPSRLRPRTGMPTFRLKDQEILHLAAFLSSRKELSRELPPPSAAGSVPRGQELFTERGCVACHSVDRGDPAVSRLVPNLADAGWKLSGRWVLAWLENPVSLNPQTPMPNLMLTPEERRDLASYLATLKNEEAGKILEADQLAGQETGDPEEGRRLVQLFGCYGCHGLRDTEQLPRPGVEVAEVAKKRLEELPFGNSQVPRTKWDWVFNKIQKPAVYETQDMPLKMPDYPGLSEEEVEALTVYYLQNRYYELPERYLARSTPENKLAASGEWMLDRFHCRACHQIEENVLPRIDRFVSLKSLAPPRLVNEAERVQPQWFFQYLTRPVVLRPWLKIRMPQFNWTYEERKNLIAYFAGRLPPEARKNAEVPYVLMPVREDYDPEIIAMGEYRVHTDKCVQCHPISLDGGLPEGVNVEDLSINLMLTKNRLRYEWIKNFLRNPDAYAGAGTKMPFVYYTPDGVPRVPDPEKWIEYSTLYLLFMEKPPEMPKETGIEEIRPGADVDWTQY